MTYTAEMRSRELAIRESLGATRLNVAGLVLRGAAMQAVVGAAGGVLVAGLLAAYLQNLNVDLSLMGGTAIVSLLLED